MMRLLNGCYTLFYLAVVQASDLHYWLHSGMVLINHYTHLVTFESPRYRYQCPRGTRAFTSVSEEKSTVRCQMIIWLHWTSKHLLERSIFWHLTSSRHDGWPPTQRYCYFNFRWSNSESTCGEVGTVCQWQFTDSAPTSCGADSRYSVQHICPNCVRPQGTSPLTAVTMTPCGLGNS